METRFHPEEAATMITLTIPFYKRIDFLKLAIESAVRQTSSEWRLIVSDDGGVEPGAEALVKSFQDDRITYSLSSEHLGMVGNWNRCLELAKTDFVTILHADDELAPTYVESMLAAWKKHSDAAAIFCQAKIIGEHGSPVFSFPDLYKRVLMPSFKTAAMLEGETGVLGLVRGNFIFCPSLCYRKSSLEELRFDPKWKMVQDLDFTTSLLFQGGEISGIPEIGYSYRRHAENATQTYTRSLLRFEEELHLLKAIEQKCKAKNWKKAQAAARRATIVKLHLLYRITTDTLSLRWKDASNKARLLNQVLSGKFK